MPACGNICGSRARQLIVCKPDQGSVKGRVSRRGSALQTMNPQVGTRIVSGAPFLKFRGRSRWRALPLCIRALCDEPITRSICIFSSSYDWGGAGGSDRQASGEAAVRPEIARSPVFPGPRWQSGFFMRARNFSRMSRFTDASASTSEMDMINGVDSRGDSNKFNAVWLVYWLSCSNHDIALSQAWKWFRRCMAKCRMICRTRSSGPDLSRWARLFSGLMRL